MIERLLTLLIRRLTYRLKVKQWLNLREECDYAAELRRQRYLKDRT